MFSMLKVTQKGKGEEKGGNEHEACATRDENLSR